MVICDEIIRLVQDEKVKNNMLEFYTDGMRTHEDTENLDYGNSDAIFEKYSYDVFSYDLTRYPKSDQEVCPVYVLAMSYDKAEQGVHIYYSSACEIDTAPEDLRAVVEHLEEIGYKEIATKEFYEIMYQVPCLNKDYASNLGCNINLVYGIPNKTTDFYPSANYDCDVLFEALREARDEGKITNELSYDDVER